MEEFKKEIKRVLKDKDTGKRENRQAEVLKITRERTKYLYKLYQQNKITDKELGNYIRKEECDMLLIQHWKKAEKREVVKYVCCMLCIRKGRRCICRKVSGTVCTNCLCSGECMVAVHKDMDCFE
ncbi:uncharacterized protein NEPG_00115 [Nematocida parisii ERTm1]|uniref:Uncharacterized protein n=1 Tax=Nematocida parisii (strain ERTm3) TaxID=935791 RepID=I3EE64_NEMP3|nr:uncharacterized protein NEPG_00115 [Nematocida parisii ERTm1]EIJ87511.1 hypothetical protein NEQG_02392 [Nematocida parisii ERTm3]EIJ94593.1 hypothetical protein NEPG_00115 [Nematocida parisii ERTm1]|eukprot:XP_013057949.1 hypothetical protein NEPG_00115 [Nematocida parisii ERTm1]